MTEEKRPTTRFEVNFSKPSLVRNLFRKLSEVRGLAWSVVRGRITRTDGRYELELCGGKEATETILSRCARRGLRVRILEIVP
jgi:hypothetical protein